MKCSPRSVPAQAMQLCVALSRRIFASSNTCTEATISAPAFSQAGRPAMKRSSMTHWMKLSAITGAASAQPVAASTRAATSAGGRGVMRSTMSFGQVVFASTQARNGASPRRSKKSSSPARKRSPLLRRLSQFSSVTGPQARRLRSARIAATAP